MNKQGGVKLLTGNSHPDLARAVAKRLGISVCGCQVKKFSDGETSVGIDESVREEDVYIIQTGFNPTPEVGAPPVDPNDLLMELLILISACKTASAKRITAVIPCFPYSRMDRKDRSRAPITAKLVANMLQVAGCDHVITIDLHASQIQGFFDIPVDNLWTEPLVVRWIRASVEDWKNSIIVSPDAGGAKRATALADQLDVDFALINRKRARRAGVLRRSVTGNNSQPIDQSEISLTDAVEEKMEILVGDVRGKNAILIDDMIDTGETLSLAAKELHEAGSKAVYAIVSHGLLSGDALSRLSDLPVLKLVVTNTIDQKLHFQKSSGKLETMDVSPILAESIRRTHNGESISLLFSGEI
ncbi:ribose-phosphate pyrophosphokinase [Phakopsora pachyrhizi]|uniref:ribose-phosphate diphosphokinase n=1 Tax=Phakopsora pachyrhizi TaxID=170000 RepID=A0AAV0BDH0_PHAPC|nr:ribose-phosphate pyrophosphokinase [Phakopsora pachyrhizi]CAH7685233.1 ribose-phosphate pyrophosphokinase [Phakopsora pachyrhizi]